MKTANLHIQSQQTPGTRQLKKATSSNIKFKLLKTNKNEKSKEQPEEENPLQNRE